VAGSGIGLAVVRELVAAHRGACWVEEAPGGGARFVVELPGGRRTASVEAA
jgi:signal transduction histidine kinase